MTSRIMIQSGSASHVGKVRKENQDRCGWFKFKGSAGYLIIVADGMGGHFGGGLAAQTAIDSFEKAFQSSPMNPIDSAEKAFNMTIAQLQSLSKGDSSLINMGTTVSLVIYYNGLIYTAHIGDSRIYYFSALGAEQISQDHSMVQEMVRQGLITSEQARNRHDDNVLIKAITSQCSDKPDYYPTITPEIGDVILVCSDGLWKMVSNSLIHETVVKYDAQDAADELVKLANANGGEDNVSVSLMKFVR